MILPARDFLLIDVIQPEDTLPSGIVLPQNNLPRPNTGKIISVGPEVKNFTPGQIILFGNFIGIHVRDADSGNDLLAIHENEIVATIS